MTHLASLDRHDRLQLSHAGIPLSEIERQLEIFRQPQTPVRLVRPCRPDDGILRFSEDRQTEYLRLWETLTQERRLAKFVPASGAASRMFKELAALQTTDDPSSTNSRAELAPIARQFIQSIRQFAFFPQLASALIAHRVSVDSLLDEQQTLPLVSYLLDERGLGYRKLPKGLIPFHAYPGEARTAAVEHLWEGTGYLAASGGTGRIHFTTASDFSKFFETHVRRALARVEEESSVHLEIGFSTQGTATDTIAVDLQNQLFRKADGSLLLRPAGHGALLDNLQQVEADLVFIKNIDNVSHRRLQAITNRWKQILGGYCFKLQTRIFDLLSKLEDVGDPTDAVDQAKTLVQENLALELPQEILEIDPQNQRSFWIRLLDRPLRVCGVVRNTGEPGGGPFWLQNDKGRVSGQIVESAQVDLDSHEQATLWNSSTHFNPVDLVCSLRDRQGKPYRLQDYVDPATAFVARKSHHGTPLNTMERPGLWNGAMAYWNTAFVEVPLATFTPVKTVFDLLRPEHQP